jgi:hypothetical protein
MGVDMTVYKGEEKNWRRRLVLVWSADTRCTIWLHH